MTGKNIEGFSEPGDFPKNQLPLLLHPLLFPLEIFLRVLPLKSDISRGIHLKNKEKSFFWSLLSTQILFLFDKCRCHVPIQKGHCGHIVFRFALLYSWIKCTAIPFQDFFSFSHEAHKLAVSLNLWLEQYTAFILLVFIAAGAVLLEKSGCTLL